MFDYFENESAEDIIRKDLRKFNKNDYKDFKHLYNMIDNNDFKLVLSSYHFKLNEAFEKINRSKSRINANDSRELICLFERYRNFNRSLKETDYDFNITEEYSDILSECKDFLKESNGSIIPSEFRKIEIIQDKVVFNLNNYIEVSRGCLNEIFKTKLIGNGSYANVYKYKDKVYDDYFVIKKAKKDLREDENERFKREFEETKNLNSPYIIKVYKFDEEKYEYIMEYADEDIESYINSNNNKLDICLRRSLCNQIIQAFKYIHSKDILHRDISPKNILVKKYEDLVVIKVSDFGLVKLSYSDLTKKKTEIKGYFNDYQDLEKVGFENYSLVHETYAITRVLYFVMTGKQNLTDAYRSEYKKFIEIGTSNNKSERYQNMDDLQKEFNNIKFK